MFNRKRSYTYELVDPALLLSRVRQDLKEWGEEWETISQFMPQGHVEYQPIRNNPMRSGYRFEYRQAGLNLNLYFPEKQFNAMLDILDKKKVQQLKAAFQNAIPERSGYIISEFKIRGILDDPKVGES